MLADPAPPVWDSYIEASPLLVLLLVEALSSKSFTGGKEIYQASYKSILRQISVRSRKGSLPPPLSYFLEDQSNNII